MESCGGQNKSLGCTFVREKRWKIPAKGGLESKTSNSVLKKIRGDLVLQNTSG